MDIKDLNRVQLIMLALLLSFVTSLATGITTVTLMQQAPTSVTVPINRVVRQTVEKIVPVEGKTTVQTVVVKEEDLVVDAISKNKSSVVEVSKEVFDSDGNKVEVSAGLGVAVSTSGLIAVDSVLVPERGTYYVKNDSGKFRAEFVSADKSGYSFVKVTTPLNDKDKFVATLPVLGDIKDMKAGQKVLVIGSSITSFIYDGKESMKLNVTNSNAGGLVLNLEGEALGIATLNSENSFVSIGTIFETAKPLVGNTQ